MKTREDIKAVQVSVKANLLESDGHAEKPQGVAYAFSSGGRLLAQKPLDEKGHATLSLPVKRSAQRIRVLVGPDLREKEFSLADLTRKGAVERVIRIDPQELTPALDFSILPGDWLCWLQGLVFVNGNLYKRTESGGVTVDLPVHNAIVEVYEVDRFPWIIQRLPDSIIEQLRDLIVRPIPQPIPDPPPFAGLPTINAIRPGFNDKLSRVALNPQPLPPRETFSINSQASAVAFDPQPDPPAVVLPEELRYRVANVNQIELRQILIEQEVFIRPLLCYYFPHFVTMQHVATTTTDECGGFFTAFSMGCSDDKPDLYFKAKQRILPPPFEPFTIYAPTPIACHTYWNYQSGTEVNLYTTSPFAFGVTPCQPVIAPNNWVLFMAVGNYPVQMIQQNSAAVDFGLATQARSGAHVGSPFGGLLRFRVEFDNSLREDLGVKYYQMSYRQGNSGPFQPLTMEVHRHYTHEVDDDLILEVYPLGPKVVGSTANLFEIPPAMPPVGQWSFPDLYEDLTSAKFPSGDLAPAAQHGKYQFKLDLFDETGAPVDITAKGIKYRIPDADDFNGDIPTQDAVTAGLVSGNSMIVTLHIDNNVCSAAIQAPTLNGNAAGDDCGVLEYDPDAPGTVAMPYTASHPTGFAFHDFTLYRGVNPLTPPSVDDVPVGSGSFSPTSSTTSLLGSCTVAGYSENVYVVALATDGISRLSGYDAGAVRAFVLSPINED